MKTAVFTSARGIAVGLLGLLLACGVASALLWRSSAAGAAREAQRRWAASPAPHYRLQVEETYRLGYLEARCRQDVDVQGELVAAVRRNDCPRPPQTVSDLLAQMQHLTPVTCISFGCACDFVGELRAEYDPQLGHPRRVTIRWASVPNWLHPDYWRAAWQLGAQPRCTPATSSIDRTLVVTLTPLP